MVVSDKEAGFSTLKILATVKHEEIKAAQKECFSTLKILATVKLFSEIIDIQSVLVPLRF